jgi:Zn-dependent peptidase ImmA (M78 family)/transcriptional regulator with XRE-family HTH domain
MNISTHFNRILGKRIRLAREEAGLTQDELSKRLGFKDRQTLSSIESGSRRLRAEELSRLIELMGKPLGFFTDPFTLFPGELEISWRANVSERVLARLEPKLANLLAAYREFGNLLREPHIQLDFRLDVKRSDSLDRAAELGEALSMTWGIWKSPAASLAEVIEEKLSILLLSLELPEKVSGASFRLEEFSSIMINRREPYYRRNFDLAHELFHLLTWEKMQPHKCAASWEVNREGTWGDKPRPREELLSNAFASGLLMPRQVLESVKGSLERMQEPEWMNRVALELRVSGEALYWRLVNLNWIEKDTLVSRENLRFYGEQRVEEKSPKLYSRIFVEKLHRVLDRGFVSVRKAAALLDSTVEDLAGLFKEYRMPVPFDL